MFHRGRDKRQFLRIDLQALEDLEEHIRHQDSKNNLLTVEYILRVIFARFFSLFSD